MKAGLTRAAAWCSQGTLRARWLGFFPSFPVWGHVSFHTCPRDLLFPALSWLFGIAAHPDTSAPTARPLPWHHPLLLPGSPGHLIPSFFLVNSKRGGDTGENSAPLCPRGWAPVTVPCGGDSRAAQQEWQPCCAHPRVPKPRPVHQVVADTGTGLGQHCPGSGKAAREVGASLRPHLFNSASPLREN